MQCAAPYIVVISFLFSENDGEVELDDVWFAYPSRPSHMILKVNIFRLHFLARDMDIYDRCTLAWCYPLFLVYVQCT
jgi:hypothetical protein